MNTKVYISIPVLVDWNTVTDCVKRLEDKYNVAVWDRGQNNYNSDWVRSCDVFIIMLPKSKWNGEISTLPVGVRRELKEAMRLDKPIYLAYKPSSGNWEFYETSIDAHGEGFISGLPGTSARLYEEYEPAKMYPVVQEYPVVREVPMKKMFTPTSYDRRILLAYC